MDILKKEELRIIDLFRSNLFRQYTIREIMKTLQKTSYGGIFDAVKRLNSLNIIKIEKKGNSNLCSLNLDENLTLTYLSLLEETDPKIKTLPLENIKDLIKIIKTPFFVFMVTGSYAEGKPSQKSDLDIVILVEDSVKTKTILNQIKNKGELMIPEIHPYVFTKSEFLEMLLNEEANYGKLVFQKRLIIKGAENYYQIVKEAVKNGFRN